MTHSSPIPTRPAPAVPGRQPLLTRWKLTEPVRLYLYSVLVTVVIPGAVLAGWLTGDWTEWALGAVGTVLTVGVGGEAARSTVYSPVGMVGAARQAVDQDRAAR